MQMTVQRVSLCAHIVTHWQAGVLFWGPHGDLDTFGSQGWSQN